jgi:hypothetical protein
MQTMRVLLASAALLLFPTIAAAESYDVLSWNRDRVAAVDRDSLTEAGGLKRIRIAVVYAQPKGQGPAAYRGMLGLQEFDCTQGRFHTLESTPFDDAGAPITALASSVPTAWTTITAGTLGADERGRVCEGTWPAGAYRTKLPILVAAYLLRPQPADVRTAGGPAQTAAQAGADASATPVISVTPR